MAKLSAKLRANDMSADIIITPIKLRSWFWCMLFFTPLFALVANGWVASTTKGEGELPGVIVVDLLIVPSLVLICSAFCAVHLSRVRTGRAHLGWILGGLAGFCVLNLGLSFGGCMLGATLGEKLLK